MEVITGKRVDRCADRGVDDNFEQRESSAEGVCPERQGRRRCEKRVHDVIRVRGEANHEQQLRSLLDRADHSLDRRCFR